MDSKKFNDLVDAESFNAMIPIMKIQEKYKKFDNNTF